MDLNFQCPQMFSPLGDLEVEPGLTVRILGLKDAKELAELVGQNKEHLSTWLPIMNDLGVEKNLSFVLLNQERPGPKTAFLYGIFLEGKMVGFISYHTIYWQTRHALMGYWIDRGYEGRGIVTKVCRSLLEYGFEELELNRIEIRCAVKNEKSSAIPQRLGFVKEGVLREVEVVNGKFMDQEVYSLLRREFSSSS